MLLTRLCEDNRLVKQASIRNYQVNIQCLCDAAALWLELQAAIVKYILIDAVLPQFMDWVGQRTPSASGVRHGQQTLASKL